MIEEILFPIMPASQAILGIACLLLWRRLHPGIKKMIFILFLLKKKISLLEGKNKPDQFMWGKLMNLYVSIKNV